MTIITTYCTKCGRERRDAITAAASNWCACGNSMWSSSRTPEQAMLQRAETAEARAEARAEGLEAQNLALIERLESLQFENLKLREAQNTNGCAECGGQYSDMSGHRAHAHPTDPDSGYRYKCLACFALLTAVGPHKQPDGTECVYRPTWIETLPVRTSAEPPLRYVPPPAQPRGTERIEKLWNPKKESGK